MRLVAAGMGALALAGCVLPMGMPGMGSLGIATNPADARAASANLTKAQADGAAQASRPGDAAMDCPAIEAELMALTQDPQFKQAMASMGATAKGQKAKVDAAQAGRASAPTAADVNAPLSIAGNLTTMMPQFTRFQTLNDLASAKKCPFLKAAKTN
jgi:hypothetical protein